MSENIAYMPFWKEGATPEERLLELAMIARLHPERFEKFVIVYQEIDRKENLSQERQCCFGVNVTEAIGLLRLGEYSILRG